MSDQQPQSPRGPLIQVLADDHRRLERLLDEAVKPGKPVNQALYDQFRAGLLRHIGIEEKILLPAAQRFGGGEPLALAPKLRLDHGAIASLLMPTPVGGILETLCAILDQHNLLEEGPGGLYETCERLAGDDCETLIARVLAAPELSVIPHSDTPAVMGAVQRAVSRAGYTLSSELSAS